jgi:hypothetical protein
MKTHITIAVVLALATQISSAMTTEDKESFAEYYRAKVNLAKEFPDKQQVLVIFTDLNSDGVVDALATSYGSYYETGWDWSAFSRKGQSWEPIKGVDATTKAVHAWSNIFARPGEISRITTSEGKVEFLVLGQVFDNLTAGGLGELNKTRFWVDEHGVIQQEKVQNLEQHLAYRGVHRDKLIQEMQVLKVETFDIPKKDEPNKAVEPTR